jgi:hypothetical protein
MTEKNGNTKSIFFEVHAVCQLTSGVFFCAKSEPILFDLFP